MTLIQDLPSGPLILGICGLLCYAFWRTVGSTRSRSGHLPLPPGPPGLPLIGNMLDYPKDSPWMAFKELSKQYGKSLTEGGR